MRGILNQAEKSKEANVFRPEIRQGGGYMKVKQIFVLVLILAVVIVLAQNTEVVDFQIFVWKVSMSRSIFLAVNVLVGIAIGLSLKMRSKKKIR